MTETTASNSGWSELLCDPFAFTQAATAYAIDGWQRMVLYADIERQVGDQYQDLLGKEVLSVLNFPSEPVMSGAELPRPTNYSLVRIVPPDDQKADEARRPFIVIDPRAGHGPGIGGFKPDSEIGAAIKAGHPCYFVGFRPDPVPGQSVEDVMRSFAAFAEHVASLHPESPGKPAVIGNCQAGWQLLMAAAVWPDLFGPLMVAGTPLSYWAGDNPMRYAGGLTGGSWVTELTTDLGAGRFDGAWLVQNFENLDPANTLWTKQYNVYSKADTEAERYLGFEKYWGGYVFLDAIEIQYTVDNLFIGNKLSTSQLLTSDGIRIDLRSIRSPIIVFCSYGDNITPPGQALGWITDLYRDDREVLSHDQTIVYTTHDSIGHLGIFVSSGVGQKEHRKFASLIDQIDLFPAGIYRATVDAVEESDDFADPYLMTITRSGIEEVRDIVQPDPASDRRFAAAARVSEINLALYRNTLQPWIRAFSTSYSARWLEALHPLRMSFAYWSSEHPLARQVSELAESVRHQRQPVSTDNSFLRMQEDFGSAIEHFLDRYRDHRDQIYQMSFDLMFGSPWLRALAGQSLSDDSPARPHPGASPEHQAMVAQAFVRLGERLHEGGLAEAALRALFHVLKHQGSVDERLYHHGAQLVEDGTIDTPDMEGLRRLVREQALLLTYHGDAAVDAIPELLNGEPAEQIDKISHLIAGMTQAGGSVLSDEATRALAQVTDIFRRAAERAREADAAPSDSDRHSEIEPPAPSAGTERPSTLRNTPGRRPRKPRRKP